MVINRRIKCYLNTNYVKTYKHKSIIYSAILKYGLSVVQMKERNNNNHPFLGRKHSKESKLKMSLSSHLSLPVKILDIETGKEKLFNSNVQAANFLKISELTIRKYKKSGAVFKNRWSILAVYK